MNLECLRQCIGTRSTLNLAHGLRSSIGENINNVTQINLSSGKENIIVLAIIARHKVRSASSGDVGSGATTLAFLQSVTQSRASLDQELNVIRAVNVVQSVIATPAGN